MEWNKQELRTIINALKLQIQIYTQEELQKDRDEEELAEVIMDRGYAESLLSAVEDYYSQSNHHSADAKFIQQYG